ncbi:nitroreductase family protein [Nocardioides sp. Iso805N]|uniref:nitroreductase family protein n=1 Tax=Nocardioides sp. Iso805N TaxID=1283287 RepID=UPI0003677AE5|nr:nitroreductase family protein [Nocardioides sp. Iso805N]
MELSDVMRTTAAIREFTADPLPDAVLARILELARFAPSGGNRQGVRIVAVRDHETRERMVELTKPGVRRYVAQIKAGEGPWNPLTPPGPTAEEIAATKVPDSFIEPLRHAPVVLVVLVDQAALASTDQDLDRVGLVGGASVFPLVWNILLAARAEGYGGVITTMAASQEPAVLELLGAPASHAVACVVPLGRPVHQPTRLRRREVAEFVTRERFDGEPLEVTSP